MTTIALIFILGYTLIALENRIRVSKSAIAVMTGVLLWSAYMFFSHDYKHVVEQLIDHLGDVSQILFFLLGAMTIVEMIDAHDGFQIITTRIKTANLRVLLWIIGFISFFCSSILDNMTTTIVMVALIRKLVSDRQLRLMLAGVIVIAANAGGAWTVIGDVTTTMLWIGGQVTTINIMHETFAASMVCLIVPLLWFSRSFKGTIDKELVASLAAEKAKKGLATDFERNTVFALGVGALIFVPVFKGLTHLPPFMGMLFGLSVLWIVTEIMHRSKKEEDKHRLCVAYAIRRVDIPTIVFFLGILLAVAGLQSTGALGALAAYVSKVIPSNTIVATIIGLLSAIIDNVPLVAAVMRMYSLQLFPPDHYFWELIAYTAGTGGSILIIGSAAGVAAMGMERIDFFWYMKYISTAAALGYFAGIGVFVLQNILF